jgi:SP family general alpha glucoside:H+ symporter-like MFS transporter
MIGIAPLSIQPLCGILFVTSYLTFYIQLAGYSAAASYKISIAASVLSTARNITSWFLVDRFGRRDLTIFGISVITVIMLIVVGLGTQTTNVACVKGVIGLLLF